MKKRNVLLITILALCMALILTACGENAQQHKLIDGDSVNLSKAWDNAIASETGAEQFYIKTEVRTDKASNSENIYAGSVYVLDSNGDFFIFVANSTDNGNNASVYFVARKDGSELARYVYHTDIPFEGTNHKIVLSVSYLDGEYYLGINGSYIQINKDSTPSGKNGSVDFFASGDKKFGVGATGDSNTYHENIESVSDKTAVANKRVESEVTLTLNAENEVNALLSANKVLIGSKVVLTVTPPSVVEGERIQIRVTYDGKSVMADISGSSHVYTITAVKSGEIKVEYDRAYKVSGSFSYADGLFSDGDIVSVVSDGGITGSVNNTDKTFEIYLPIGEQKIVLSSSRFSGFEEVVNVKADMPAVISEKIFEKIKFEDGTVLNGDELTLQEGDYKLYAGVSVKDFYASVTVTRMDEGEATSGIFYYTAGMSSPVKILLLKNEDTVKIRLTRGLGWDDRSDRDYVTNVVWRETLLFEVIVSGETLYVGIDGSWFEITSATEYTQPVNNTDFDTNSVWNADAQKTFGVFANGESEIGFPISDLSYEADSEQVGNKLAECYYTVSLSVVGDIYGSAELSSTKVLKGGKLELTVTAEANCAVKSINFNEWMNVFDAETGKYTVTPTADGTITVEFEQAYLIEGSFGYAENLKNTEGDVVTIFAGDNVGTINSDGTFSINLTEGTYSLTLRSTRFADVTKTITVANENIAIADKFLFTVNKFTNGVSVNGEIDINSWDDHVYAGFSGKNFGISATLDSIGGWGTSSLIIVSGDESIRVFLNGDNQIVFERLGVGHYRFASNVSLSFPCSYSMKLICYNGTYYISINDSGYTVIDVNTNKLHADENVAAWIFDKNAVKTFGFSARDGADSYKVSSMKYYLGDTVLADELYVSVTLSTTGCDSCTAEIVGEDTVIKGQTITLKITCEADCAVKTLDVNVWMYAVDADGYYVITPTASGVIRIEFETAYLVDGTFGYETGLYSDGDTITVFAGDNVGTVNSNGTFSINLTEGTYLLTLRSTRFADVTKAITVTDENITIAESLTFSNLKFENGGIIENGNYTLINGDYKLYAGVSVKDFYASATVTRMDEGESTSGIFYYTAGTSSPIKVLLLRNDDGTARIRLTRGTGWDDRSDRDYATGIAWKNTFLLEVIVSGGTLYVGIDGSWFEITSATEYTQPVNNTDFDTNSVWNADAQKTFGVFANGSSDTGFPLSNLLYEADSEQVESKLAECYYTISLSVVGGSYGSAELSSAKVLKGGKLELTVKAEENCAVESIDFNGWVNVFNAETGKYTVTPTADGTITVEFEQAYLIEGTFEYATGLYSDGDTVTVFSNGGSIGTVENGAFSIRLVAGEHTITLRSTRFVDVTTTVTVGADGTYDSILMTFATAKFTDGTSASGTLTLNNEESKMFAGISAKNFMLCGQVSHAANDGGWASSTLAFENNGSLVRVFVSNNNGKATIMFVTSVDGNWVNNEYITDITHKGNGGTYNLTLICLNGVYYVSIDDSSYITINTGTNMPSWVFDTDSVKAIGVTGFVSGDNGKHSVSDVSYTIGNAAIDEALFYVVSLSVVGDSYGSAELSSTKVLKGGKLELTVTAEENCAVKSIDFNEWMNVFDAETGKYTVTPTANGTITVEFEQAYLIEGTFGYATGLYSDGETVTVFSNGGSIGTAANGTFSIRLVAGTHTITLRSTRFADVTKTITVADENITIAESLTFSNLKFENGGIIENGNYTLINGDYRLYAGVSVKDFYASATVTRMDEGESTSGIFYYTVGSTSPVKVLLLRNDDGTTKIRLTRGTGWDDRNDRDYATSIAWNNTFLLEVIVSSGTLYVGIDGSWFEITSATEYTQVVNNTGFDENSVWNADEQKTFGVFANGGSDTGFPLINLSYEVDATALSEKLAEING